MKRNLLFTLILLAGLNAFGQESKTAPVKFDPLFWKEDLNLKAAQQNRIRDINIKFYENIQTEFQDLHNDLTALRVKVDENLAVRSREIWNTLDARQRKKWEKLMRQYEDNQI